MFVVVVLNFGWLDYSHSLCFLNYENSKILNFRTKVDFVFSITLKFNIL